MTADTAAAFVLITDLLRAEFLRLQYEFQFTPEEARAFMRRKYRTG